MRRIFLLILISATCAFAQTGSGPVSYSLDSSAVFQRFTEADGLSQNTVTAILQDNQGFLWVGTVNGLNRFDGYRFVVYKFDFQDPHSISNNYIVSIRQTRSGQIWIGTNKGLNLYDPAINGFKSFRTDIADPSSLGDDEVRTLYEDKNGTLWIGTENGLTRYNPATENFTNFASSTVGQGVRGIAEDPDGGFWIGSSDGLFKLDRQTGQIVKHFKPDPKDSNSLSMLGVRNLIIDHTGMAWIATLGGGLNKFDPKTEQFIHYKATKNVPRSLADDGVRSVYESKNGTIWAGTALALHAYSRETDDFTVYKHDPTNPLSLSEGDIPTIYEGNNDQLWVGTGIGGLSKLNQKANRFKRFRHEPGNSNSLSDDYYIHSIWEDENKILWVATQSGGLNRFDAEAKRFEVVQGLGVAKTTGTEVVTTIFRDREGEFWLGGPLLGLVKYDRKTGLFRNYVPNKDDPQSLSDSRVISILEDHAGNLWVGTARGINQLDRTNGKFTRFPFGINMPGALNGDLVLSIFEDSLNGLWVGTNRGLNKFDETTQTFKHYRPDPNDPTSFSSGSEVSAIVEDKTGTVWFGTDAGLNRFDRAADKFSRFTEGNGFPSNTISSMLVDDTTGNIWAGTGKGLARLDPASGHIRVYDVNDGLTHAEFTPTAAFRNANGDMYFGAIRGIVKFNPKNFKDSDFLPSVYLSDIRIFEQPVRFTQSISDVKTFNISWRDNVVSFDFAALDFTDPKKLQYQWKLDGFDDNWINGGTRRTATYTNLPGGEYVLKVRATNADGIWGGEELNLIVRVQPPFYRTAWFLALLAISIVILVWLVYRYRINQLHAISEAQTRFTQQLITSQEAERKRIAAELHDGLGQSLVIIKNRAMLGISKGDDKERVARELSSISESASQALDEVREITNNLRPQLLDRLGLTKAIAAMLKKYAGVIDIKSEIDTIDGLFEENEEISIYRIVQESVNNTIKHSNASTAKVKIKRIENRILVEITDNGKGFDPQSLPTEKRSFGLTGLRERAQLLGGELVIDSQIGIGTKVSVTFPVKGNS